eukprot:1853859-Alexandrium_andersonii.AAC.1
MCLPDVFDVPGRFGRAPEDSGRLPNPQESTGTLRNLWRAPKQFRGLQKTLQGSGKVRRAPENSE